LGESSIAYSHLVDACHVGSRIFTLHSSANLRKSQKVLTDVEQVAESNEKQHKNRKSTMEKYRLALNEISDEDSSLIGAPVSDNSSNSEEDESSKDNFAEWLIFGQQELDPAVDNELLELFEDDESVPDEAKDGNFLEPFDGLHWEIGRGMNEPPQDKKEHTATKIKDGYKHLFSTPVDAMFALLPFFLGIDVP
jgi:hypothetical protein